MTAEEVLRLLLSAGGSMLLLAVINAVVNRRRMGADVADKLEAVAGRWVDRADNRIAALESQVAEHERRENAWDEERREWRALLRRHADFLHALLDQLRQRGITDLPEPPSLDPPRPRM